MAVQRVVEELAARGIDVVRVGFADLMGTERSKELLLEELPAAVERGVAFCRAVYHTSPLGQTVEVPGGLDAGLPDITVLPDLDTLRPVPWEPGVASCLGDAPEAPESSRGLLARVLDTLGHQAVVGPELEYFLCEPDGRGGFTPYSPEPGNIYVSGSKGDPDGHLTATLRQLRDFGLGVLGGNHEYFPGQFEINLTHGPALSSADRAFRFKSAVKDLARRQGRLATFMAKPFTEHGASGFHLHVSLTDPAGRNLGDDPAAPHGLSRLLRHALAGVLRHAPALTALTNPTVNSYKRFGPDTLAPWLIDWGLDNRSAMVRVPPERGEGTRVEVRLPDASANPYLVYAGVLAAMRLGIEEATEPPAPLQGYGYDVSTTAVLPMTLTAALDELEADSALQSLLGKQFVTSYSTFKRAEVARYRQWVTDWEFREYAYHM
ncbi:type I glutamate--ammonia ligase [Kutzneria viridogrisea]|uniref:Glutamate--ammonia ligase n=2 Tax=Kutzneria TaxID=43356 RepID=W5W4Q3_9PSEU|nr:glutamine synthetase family protein [Kutzneria albida]AHH95456.1 glutamate--ammonia ligase [Kutzneria albida DSM 43870]MBA8927185.1 glutamine synthetase [Kutzneria viridogrisea]